MSVRTLSRLLSILLLLTIQSLANASENFVITEKSIDNPCPPVTNIEAEFFQGGKALIYWTPVPGIDKYSVKVTDENQNLIIDTLVYGVKVWVNGLVKGKKYTIKVCYICPQTGDIVCEYRDLTYVIIEDIIVMMSGNSCKCTTAPQVSGFCPSSDANLYALENERVYNVTLQNGSKQSFVVQGGVVNPVGSCPHNFTLLDYSTHGENDSELPHYDLGEAQIHFHGTSFCVSGSGIASIGYCSLREGDDGKTRERSQGELTALQVQPNPFSEQIQVVLEALDIRQPVNVQLFDARGCLVASQEYEPANDGHITAVLQTATFRPGFYVLCARQGAGELLFKRLVKQE